MLRTNLPRAIRHLRRRRRWRQLDLGARAGVSRQVVSRIERGELAASSVRSIVRVAAALDASVDLTVRWQGEELGRLIDAGHARVLEQTAALLAHAGWETRTEVSFNHYGDRGRVDLLGRHPASSTLLVAEVKSAIGDTQDTVGRLDVKARLGRVLADTLGWPIPDRVVPALVVGDTRTARRIVSDHTAAFARFDVRGRRALAWLNKPSSDPPTGLLWFAALPDAPGAGVTRRSRVRTVVRAP